jgi:hypothetical protein
MEITKAQADMRYGYFGGATGLLASATVWSVAAAVAFASSPGRAVWTLVVGGMMIHPAAMLLAKALGRPGTHTPGNPLAPLALEGTAFFLLAIPLALGLTKVQPAWFFPAMLLLIGGRYLTFATLYGRRAFWACGALLAGAGVLAWMSGSPAWMTALAGAAIEATFTVVMATGERRDPVVAEARAG